MQHMAGLLLKTKLRSRFIKQRSIMYERVLYVILHSSLQVTSAIVYQRGNLVCNFVPFMLCAELLPHPTTRPLGSKSTQAGIGARMREGSDDVALANDCPHIKLPATGKVQVTRHLDFRHHFLSSHVTVTERWNSLPQSVINSSNVNSVKMVWIR